MQEHLADLTNGRRPRRHARARPLHGSGHAQAGPTPTVPGGAPGTAPGTATAPAAGAPAAGPAPAPRELYSQAYADYARGNYDLAIQGFQEYLRAYPEHRLLRQRASTGSASASTGSRSTPRRIEAWNTLFRDFPSSDKLPDARFKKGLALERSGRAARPLSSTVTWSSTTPTPTRGARRARSSTRSSRHGKEGSMASVNKVVLIGNLGKDPEIRYTQGGEPIANFSLATSENWTDKSGQKQERTEWHRVEVFGKTAQVVRDYCTKGKQVYIEGSIRYDEWTDKDGNKKYMTKIRVSGPNSRLVLLGGRGEGGGGGRGGGGAAAEPPEGGRPSGRLPGLATTTFRSRPTARRLRVTAPSSPMATVLLAVERFLPPYRYDQEIVTGWVRAWLEESDDPRPAAALGLRGRGRQGPRQRRAHRGGLRPRRLRDPERPLRRDRADGGRGPRAAGPGRAPASRPPTSISSSASRAPAS